jgi:7SK snRNA methylphosphate capping enzyme
VFPHNVLFRTADWTTAPIPDDADCYDVVIAFSVSKWIHLNGGDMALTNFFRRIHSVLNQGGTFVLEPQAWGTYAKAKRMDEKLKENAKGLGIRPDDFESLLGGIGFGPAQHLGTIGDGGFRRPVDLYVKR